MVNWQVTATTIYCDAVDDEVTILVYKDWVTKCTGYQKYMESGNSGNNHLKQKSRKLKHQLTCTGPECNDVIQYKKKLLSEETQKGVQTEPLDK